VVNARLIVDRLTLIWWVAAKESMEMLGIRDELR
jgi:hypothetical protein